MVSDDVRDRLVEIAALTVGSCHTRHMPDLDSYREGEAVVDALLESGEVIPFDAANRAAVELDAESARYRDALEKIAVFDTREGGSYSMRPHEIARRALDDEPAAVPDRPEVSR